MDIEREGVSAKMTRKENEDVVDEDQYLQQLSLRQYQIELSSVAKKHNSIIFLPTGAGKTFIALQVLRSRMKDLVKPANKGGKIAVFLGTTKVLVHQLSEVVQENTNLKVKIFLGEMGVDDWTNETWKRETDGAQVLVMVPAIFQIILQRNIVKPNKVSLIVFDECHHAVLNHPYRQIMQEIESTPEVQKPLVLGLTATVLNSNPSKDGIEEVILLKKTFSGNIAKTDRLEEALRYGTSANEQFVTYGSSGTTNAEQFILKLIKTACDRLDIIKISSPVEERAASIMPKGGVLLVKKNVIVKEIRNILKHLERALSDLGLYPASIVALYYYIRLERLKLIKENPAAITAIKYALTILNLIRRTVFKYVPMNNKNRVRKFSSKKVNALIDFVDKYKDQENLRCIIMVEEKITAVTLSAMFNELSQNGDSFYKADFATGGLFSSVFDQEETKFEQKRLKRVVASFRDHDFNFLIATDVVEEGMDIPTCNLVIKFDNPKDYRSYIQSKGRARFKDSQYIVFCKEEDKVDVSSKVKKFNVIQKNLLKALVTAEGVKYDIEEDEGDNEIEDEVFYVKGPDGPRITATKAVSFVMRYCTRLPQDKFSFLAPICWYDGEKKKAFLRLPSSSPVKKTIEGDERSCQRLAKKNVFLKTVMELYKAGEVMEDLSLRSYKCKDEEHKDLFKNIIEVSSDKRRHPGGPGKRRKYKLEYSKSLSQCMPKPMMESYIHVIKITPQFPRPEDSRLGMFYDLLSNPNGFAILSSKRLTEICEFPLFVTMGDFKCSVTVNAATVLLNVSDLEKLRKFHFFIFNTLLRVVNRLQIFDNIGEGYSFFVVPVKYEEGKPVIDWDTVINPVWHTQNAELSEMQTENPSIDDYVKSVVYPKYRPISCTNKFYIVTSLDWSQNPMSPFPSEDFANYYNYFLNKYEIRIGNKEQPLLEVKAIAGRINYIKPRRPVGVRNKKFEEENDNFKEHLVPELCVRVSFPALFWLKATLLPSALHRITTISHVDDVRNIIASETKIGVCEKGDNFSWLPLEVEKEIIEEESSSQLQWIYKKKQRLMKSQDESPELQSPVDLFRHMNECAPCDLIHYVKFFGLIPDDDAPVKAPKLEKMDISENLVIADEPDIEVPDLPLIIDNHNEKGPELRDFVKVFTCKAANDIVDLEKLEFLGDSFLKFSAALYVFRTCEDNEGVLVSLKDRIVSNKNLYCCGIRKGFQGVLVATEFDPKSGWNAPLFCLPPEIKSLITEDTGSFDIEYSFEIPVADKISGKLNAKAVKAIQDFTNMEEKPSVYTPDEIVLGRKTIPDKSIADCVEALLGLYIKECGLIKGFKMLNWLNILPKTGGTYDDLMAQKYVTPEKTNMKHIMDNLQEMCYEDLEKVLGYEFKDKSLLLEALTHPSVIDTSVPSYQRLEFLGDAVIDFIVTLYIHHSCPDLAPGDTTDIRMSLVNNLTMACLAVKYNFHKFLICQSTPLLGAISRFVNFQRERNHKIDVAVNVICEEGECKLSEAIEVPKALGDLFESLAGAIFLDSGLCLRTVWKSYYRLMKDALETFLKDPPKSPIRKLYEYCKPPPEFKYIFRDDGFVVAICKIIHLEKEHTFHGRATNRQYSKLSAAKHAIGFLEGLIDEG